MDKKHLLIFTFFIAMNTIAQSYIGFFADNYNGIHGVISNPANIADSKYKLDINLAGASALIGNDFFGFETTRLLEENYTIGSDAARFPKNENNIFGNADILGPSALINIDEKSAIALFTRVRSFYNINSIDGEQINILDNGFDQNQDFNSTQSNVLLSTNTWAEIGFTYSSILIQENQHFVKGGFTFKYLKGLGNAYANTDNLSINYDADSTVNGANSQGSVVSNGDLTYGYSKNFKDDFTEIESVSGAGALGLDVGLIYEWRPNELSRNYTGYNKYKLKLGLSVTDIGSITYDNIEERYNLFESGAISQDNFETIRNPQDIRLLYNISSTGQTEKAVLPTAFHLNADWNLNQKLYLNLNTDLSLINKSKINRSRIANMVTVTPRYESKWFTVQTPISYQQYSGLNMGAGLRAGPFYIGTGSGITALLNNEAKSIDLYAGIKIGLFKRQSKDQDKDGVPDKLDRCKDEFGAIDNHGCPWEDTDGDGLYDNEDDCPDVPGDFNNNGCPKLTFEIQETLDAKAEVILFNSNKTEITETTEEALMGIIDILNKYPFAKLIIEGHADSIGNSKLNQKVSDMRANAVRDFLIRKGIDASRLTAIGYGENKPIATNLTRKGRAENRRVEIKLVQE